MESCHTLREHFGCRLSFPGDFTAAPNRCNQYTLSETAFRIVLMYVVIDHTRRYTLSALLMAMADDELKFLQNQYNRVYDY
ncbi:MAG: hypothetical protein AAGB19_01715 [Cyanobacteria bacterium P01_F01_bin.3]